MKTYNSYIGNLGIAIFQCFTLLWVFPKDYCIKADCTQNVIFAKILRSVKSYHRFHANDNNQTTG